MKRLRVVSPLWQQVKKHYLQLLPQRYRTPLLGMDLFIPRMQLGIQSTGLILISQWIRKGIHWRHLQNDSLKHYPLLWLDLM